MLLARLLDIYSLILLVAVILSWTGLRYDHPLMRISRMLTEPLLRPIRRLLPTIGGIDFSPMVLLIAIGFLRRLLAR
jgi:YggT family protein